MLLDNGRPQNDAGDGDPDTHRMIGQAYLTVEALTQMGNGGEIRILWRRRVRAGAFKQNEILTSGVAGHTHSLVKLGQRSQPSGNYQRLARPSHFSNEWNMRVFERGYFEAWCLQR